MLRGLEGLRDRDHGDGLTDGDVLEGHPLLTETFDGVDLAGGEDLDVALVAASPDGSSLTEDLLLGSSMVSGAAFGVEFESHQSRVSQKVGWEGKGLS